MKIACDCRPLETAYAAQGIGTYCANLLPRLCASRIAPRLLLLSGSKTSPPYTAHYARIWRPRAKPWFFEQLLWPVDIIKKRISVFHSLVSLGPVRAIGFPYVCPARSIATIHDLSVLRLDDFREYRKELHFIIQRRALLRASKIITVSQFVKNDIVEKLHIPGNKIAVVPEAVDDRIRQAFDRMSDRSLHAKDRFVFSMGETVNKNIETVIAVFGKLCAAGYSGELRIAGALANQPPAVVSRYTECPSRERIRFLGRLTVEDLAGCYAQCDFFIYPSRSEGFGLPILEAMYCGAPVLASDATSLPETGEHAALYRAPGDIDGFFHDAQDILNHSSLRHDRISKGKMHVKNFSWDAAADAVVGIYEELLGKKKARSILT